MIITSSRFHNHINFANMTFPPPQISRWILFSRGPNKEVWSDPTLITGEQRPGPWFNIKMSSFQNRKSHCGDKTVVRPPYLQSGISYAGQVVSVYWISPPTHKWYPKNLKHTGCVIYEGSWECWRKLSWYIKRFPCWYTRIFLRSFILTPHVVYYARKLTRLKIIIGT